MTDYWLYVAIVAVVIVLSLAFYAGKLLKQLANQKAEQETIAAEQQASLQQHDKKVLDSVLLITRAMQQEQCEFDEGCWRLSVLLASLKTFSGMPEMFPNIFGLYGAIKNLTILDDRKALAKKARMREDYQRMQALGKFNEPVKTELDKLFEFTTEQLAKLAV